jgi:hypothetical protein
MKDVRLRLLTSLILGVPMLGACGGEGDPQGTPRGWSLPCTNATVTGTGRADEPNRRLTGLGINPEAQRREGSEVTLDGRYPWRCEDGVQPVRLARGEDS